MIPKIIHYCWFGGNPYPEKVEYCIETWKKHLPDYEFHLWNEGNFDIAMCNFTKQAYEKKQYAFVSDFVRVYALMHFGGIYLDTDIEVVKTFDEALNYNVVLGTDETGNLTAFMAAEAGHLFFADLEDLYRGMEFVLPDGSLNTRVNNQWMQDSLKQYGYELKNEHQHLELGIEVFPDEYFHAKSLVSGKLHQTKQTFCIHHHTLMWVPFRTKMVRFLRMKVLVPLLGAERYLRLVGTIKGEK